MKNVIVNADDFGLTSSVNKAIVELFDEGLLTSTTLMANMPGFEEAVDLAHQHKITGKVGVHLVLTAGTPLTEEIKALNYLFNKDTPRGALIKKLFFLDKSQKRLIFNEYCKQIETIKKNGIRIAHIDTHQHMHDMPGIMQIVMELLKVYKIPSMRILNNINVTENYKYFYRNLINGYLKIKKVNYSDYFGSRNDYLFMLQRNPDFTEKKTMEIMVHPTYNFQGKRIDINQKEEYDFDYLIEE